MPKSIIAVLLVSKEALFKAHSSVLISEETMLVE